METLNTYAQPFFNWLLRSTFQASVVICMILLIQGALRNRLTARWHYALWLILVVRMILPWAPQSRFSIFNLATWQSESNAPIAMSQPDTESSETTGESSATQQRRVGQEQSVREDGTTSAVTSDVPSRPLTAGPANQPAFRLHGVLPFLWLAGALLLGGYIIVCNLKLWRAAGIECPSTDKEILELLEECRSEIGLRTIVALVPSKKVNTPILLGFVRPRLLVPKSITKELTREELRYVLLHELAHVKRHDIALGWLTTLLQVLHWFNPFVWLAFHRMRSNRELACDALVLSHTQGEGTKDYGRAIVTLLEHFSLPQSLPGLAGILESKSQLKRRIAMITQFKNNSYHWSPLAVVVMILLACVSLPGARHTNASAFSAAKPSAIVVRQVCAEMAHPVYTGAPSPDGKYLAYSDWTALIDGGPPLTVLELTTGKTHRLTEKGSWSPFFPIFSPDSKQVAYAWHNPENKIMELRIVGLDGSEPRVLHSDREVQVFLPKDWSADGQHILAVLTRGKIALVNVSDGSIRIVKTFDTFDPLSILKLSPDGRYIAYSHPSAEDSSKADIFLLTIDGARETTLVEHPADDRVLGWAPDGKRLAFTSDRTGSIGIWVIGVTDGKPQGMPELVKPQMGQFHPLGFTRNGSLYYAVSTGRGNVNTATLDPETGKLLGQPVKAIQRFEGYNSAPEWSPDGRYLVCQSRRAGDLIKVSLIIRELESGKVRILEPECKRLNPRSLRWSPDGQSIIGFGRDNQGRQGLLQIDVQTEAVTVLAYKDLKRGGSIVEPAWAHDGKAVFFVRAPTGDNTSTEPCRIVRRELATGEEVELCRIPGRIQWLAPSPDDRRLAFCAGSAVRLVSTTGGQPRELVKAYNGCGIAWTPDGRYLLFGRKTDDEAKLALWRISAQGGEPQKTGLTFNGWVVDVRMHPDGRRIAFASKQVDKNEVWAMENFLTTTIASAAK